MSSNYIEYKKNGYNPDVAESLINEIFNNGTVLEIIKFLENDYQNIYIFAIDKETYELYEKILLDLNNNLIDKYLIRYCKSKNTFYYLLQKNDLLINQGIFNLNIISYYDKNLINILISNLEILKTFFNFYIDNYKNTLSKPNYIDSLITKMDGFNKLSDEEHIEILQNVLTLPKILNIIEKEKNDYDNWMTNKTELQFNIWDLICNLEVNINSIRLLSWISNGNYESLNKSYKNSHSIKEMLKKWSNYNYVEPKDDYDYYSNGDDYNDKINIQMLISAYSDCQDKFDEEYLKYDGVRAYRYKYDTWWSIANIDNDDKKEYVKFIDDNYKDKMFTYFKLNKDNYQEKYFQEFSNFFNPDEKIVLENFEKIGNGISYYTLWDLNNMFNENNINEEKRRYYLNLYFNQKDKNKLISNINNLSNEIEYLKNKKYTWIYVLLIGILIVQILK